MQSDTVELGEHRIKAALRAKSDEKIGRFLKWTAIVAACAVFIIVCVKGLPDDRLGMLQQPTNGAVNEQVYKRMITLLVAGDESGFVDLRARGLVYALNKDTKYRVIDPGVAITEIKVESGPLDGQYLFVSAK